VKKENTRASRSIRARLDGSSAGVEDQTLASRERLSRGLERSAFKWMRAGASPPPLLGRTKEGGRGARSKRSGAKGQSQPFARPPTPARPHHRAFRRTPVSRRALEGGGANRRDIQPNCRTLWALARGPRLSGAKAARESPGRGYNQEKSGNCLRKSEWHAIGTAVGLIGRSRAPSPMRRAGEGEWDFKPPDLAKGPSSWRHSA
jgi:hypothetical protein